MMVGAASGFEMWFQEFVFYAGPIVQLLYWVILSVTAVWAVLLLKRWVDFRTRTDDAPVSAAGTNPTKKSESEKSTDDTPVDIEKFVE